MALKAGAAVAAALLLALAVAGPARAGSVARKMLQAPDDVGVDLPYWNDYWSHSGVQGAVGGAGDRSFPYAFCIKRPAASPYLLAGTAPTFADGAMNITLTVVPNPDADTTAHCYSGLVNNVFKIAINSGKQCVGNVKVYVNGELRKGNVFWEKFQAQDDALLRITHLQLQDKILGSTFTLIGQAPCNTPEAFTAPTGGLFTYYLTNTSSHGCCPINKWDWATGPAPAPESPVPSPIPDSPLPPSPASESPVPSSPPAGSPAPETSTLESPTPELSPNPSPETSAAEKSPEASTTPSPEGSTIPSPEGSTIPSPEASTTPSPEASTTPSPEASTTPSPEASTTPSPEASTTPSPEASTTPSPEASTIPSPEASSVEPASPELSAVEPSAPEHSGSGEWSSSESPVPDLSPESSAVEPSAPEMSPTPEHSVAESPVPEASTTESPAPASPTPETSSVESPALSPAPAASPSPSPLVIPPGGSMLLVNVMLDNFWTPADLVSPVNPVDEAVLAPAMNASVSTLGLLGHVVGFLYSTSNMPLGASITYVFNSSEAAQALSQVLQAGEINTVIMNGRIPCGTTILVTLDNGNQVIFSCSGIPGAIAALPALCADTTPLVCVPPARSQSPVPEPTPSPEQSTPSSPVVPDESSPSPSETSSQETSEQSEHDGGSEGSKAEEDSSSEQSLGGEQSQLDDGYN